VSDQASKPTADDPEWDAAKAILHQVRLALGHLADTGETAQIDLRAQPLAPGDLERLLAWLGRGEVEATVTALGPTRVWESAVPGVWLVDHRDADDERLTLQIEVAPFPDILRSPPQDIEQAVATLDARLGAAVDGGP